MYPTKNMHGIIITLLVAVLIMGIAQYLLNKILNIMLINKMVPYMKRVEGGLSRDANDRASSNPAPWEYQGQTGWHTNKGITYTTFVSNADKLGYAVTKENFFTMPDEIWLKILKEVYVKGFPLSRIDHLPRIQAVIIEWSFNSGVAGAERLLANFQREVMGIQDSNITKDEIVQNFRRKITPLNEAIWFERLNKRRLEDYSKMPTYATHRGGWTKRVEIFQETFA